MYKTIHTTRTIVIDTINDKILHDTFVEREITHTLNPIDRFLVPMVNDFIQLLPMELQHLLIHVDEAIGHAWHGLSAFAQSVITDARTQYKNNIKSINLKTEGTVLIISIVIGLAVTFIAATNAEPKPVVHTYNKVVNKAPNKTFTSLPVRRTTRKFTPPVTKVTPVKHKPIKVKEVKSISLWTVNNNLPNIDIPRVYDGMTCPNDANKKVVLTTPQFKTYLKKVYNEFKKYEHTEHINPLVETARHTYEAWLPCKGGWKPSNLLVVAGNGSGIKGGKIKGDYAFVYKYDDGYNGSVYDGKPSRFVVFSRNDFYDIEHWARYQTTVVLSQSYYDNARKNYTNPLQYAYGFKAYATRADYCEVLYKRTLTVKKMLNL